MDERFVDAVSKLTTRQRQVFSLLIGGASEKEIVRTLSLSANSVHEAVKTLHRQFGVESRAELLSRVIRSLVRNDVASNRSATAELSELFEGVR